MYNSSLAFASLGADVNDSKAKKEIVKQNNLAKHNKTISNEDFERNKGVYTFKIQGAVYHNLGPLLPTNKDPSFAQIYFYDTDNEINNRLKIANQLNSSTLQKLQTMIHDVNPFYKEFKNALDNSSSDSEVKLIIRADKGYF